MIRENLRFMRDRRRAEEGDFPKRPDTPFNTMGAGPAHVNDILAITRRAWGTSGPTRESWRTILSPNGGNGGWHDAGPTPRAYQSDYDSASRGIKRGRRPGGRTRKYTPEEMAAAKAWRDACREAEKRERAEQRAHRDLVRREIASARMQQLGGLVAAAPDTCVAPSDADSSVACGRTPTTSHRLCAMHYQRWRLHGSFVRLRQPKAKTIKPSKPPKAQYCLYCLNAPTSRGMCTGHYQRWRAGWRICENDGVSFKPRPGTAGRFCSRACYEHRSKAE